MNILYIMNTYKSFQTFCLDYSIGGTLKTHVKLQDAHLKMLHASGIAGGHTNGAHTKD